MRKVKGLIIYRYSSEEEILLIFPGLSLKGKKTIQASTKFILQQLKESNFGPYERQKILLKNPSSIHQDSPPSSSSLGISQNQQNQWFCVCDSQDLISFVVCSEDYPEIKAYKLIDSLRNHLLLLGENYSQKKNQEIQAHSQTAAENLFKEYNQDNIDQIDKVNNTLKDTQKTMQKNISQMINNTDALDETRRKSQFLEFSSLKLKSQSKFIKKTQRCNNIKLIVLLSLVLIGIIVIIVVSLVGFKN